MTNYKKILSDIKASDALKKQIILNLQAEEKSRKSPIKFKPIAITVGILILILSCSLMFNIFTHLPQISLNASDNFSSVPSPSSSSPPSQSNSNTPHSQIVRQPISYEEAKQKTGWPVLPAIRNDFKQYVLLTIPYTFQPELEYEYENGYIRLSSQPIEVSHYKNYEEVTYKNKQFWVDVHQQGTVAVIYQADAITYNSIFYNVEQSEALDTLHEIII